ncbi:hypothetical protein CBL_07992 [Carabus blaptoides fortunei]
MVGEGCEAKGRRGLSTSLVSVRVWRLLVESKEFGVHGAIVVEKHANSLFTIKQLYCYGKGASFRSDQCLKAFHSVLAKRGARGGRDPGNSFGNTGHVSEVDRSVMLHADSVRWLVTNLTGHIGGEFLAVVCLLSLCRSTWTACPQCPTHILS